jgi:hypothetical protein
MGSKTIQKGWWYLEKMRLKTIRDKKRQPEELQPGDVLVAPNGETVRLIEKTDTGWLVETIKKKIND